LLSLAANWLSRPPTYVFCNAKYEFHHRKGVTAIPGDV